MLVYGCVNPPPVAEAESVFLNTRDDMSALAASLRDKPLLAEHKDRATVGKVINAWTHSGDGRMFMLAEIDEAQLGGAVAAALVQKGTFNEFSLGYKVSFQGNHTVGEKRMLEASLVKHGARPGCKLMDWSRPPRRDEEDVFASFVHAV